MRVFLIACCVLQLQYAKGQEIKQILTDVGKNVTINCPIESDHDDLIWIREGRDDRQIARMRIQSDKSLLLTDVQRNDSGVYSCSSENDDLTDHKFKIVVRTPPPKLANVTVNPSTILALILWQVAGDGGYPISYFTADYKLADSDEEWKTISPSKITPNARQIDVYRLVPNTTYAFRIWATNVLGKGEVTELTARTRFINSDAGIDEFDARIWILAVSIVMGTLVVLGCGTCCLLYVEHKLSNDQSGEQEILELLPNIILNPGFDGNPFAERIPADENSNSETALRLNNNTVIQPSRV